MFVKKLFILMLLLLGFGEDFSYVFGKWLSEMVNFSFNFKVLTSKAFSKRFCSIFCSSFSQLISNFDLFNSSILKSKAARSTLFLDSSSSSKIFCFSSSNDRSNKSNFPLVRSSAYCTINFACSAVFLRMISFWRHFRKAETREIWCFIAIIWFRFCRISGNLKSFIICS